jgi:hypothetical protein
MSKKLIWLILSLVWLSGCHPLSNRGTSSRAIQDLIPNTPYVLTSISIAPPSDGKHVIVASAIYAVEASSNANTSQADFNACYSEQSKNLVQKTVWDISRRSDEIVPLKSYKEIRSGKIPVPHDAISGNTDCYATAETSNGSVEGIGWKIYPDEQHRLHILIWVVTLESAEKISATRQNLTAIGIPSDMVDLIHIAFLRTLTRPMDDKVEIFSSGEKKTDLPSCTSRSVLKSLEAAMNQIVPGAAPHGLSMVKIEQVSNVSEFIFKTPPKDSVMCIASVTIGNGSYANLIKGELERESFGIINNFTFDQTNIAKYNYGGGTDELQVRFNKVTRSAPFHE